MESTVGGRGESVCAQVFNWRVCFRVRAIARACANVCARHQGLHRPGDGAGREREMEKWWVRKGERARKSLGERESDGER